MPVSSVDLVCEGTMYRVTGSPTAAADAFSMVEVWVAETATRTGQDRRGHWRRLGSGPTRERIQQIVRGGLDVQQEKG